MGKKRIFQIDECYGNNLMDLNTVNFSYVSILQQKIVWYFEKKFNMFYESGKQIHTSTAVAQLADHPLMCVIIHPRCQDMVLVIAY